MSKTIDKNNIITSIRSDLGLNEESTLDEAYVTQARKFNLSTELLSSKTKIAHQEIFDSYVDTLNRVSAELDTASREDANLEDSTFRSLKIDEISNLNASFLHAMYFENISDLNSKILMDSLTFLRLERDFGTFNAWQEDFIACCMSSRNGWAVTVYNGFLNRYINVVVDLNAVNVPFSSYPIIVMDCWEHAYYRDYLEDRKAYIFGMMKELNWDVVEERVKKAERISKVLK
tara:strand:- start:30 stop:725 length:696 start_codon:yes stop_codon:yes gene_type:complete